MEANEAKALKELMQKADNAMEAGLFEEAVSIYEEIHGSDPQNAVAKAIYDAGSGILEAKDYFIENGTIDEALDDRKSLGQLISVASRLFRNTCLDYFQDFKAMFDEETCYTALLKKYYFIESFIKYYVDQMSAIQIDFSDESSDELLFYSHNAYTDFTEMNTAYGTALIKTWPESELMKKAAIEIWKHFLIDNPFGLTIKTREEARFNNAYCSKYLDPIVPKIASHKEFEDAFESSVQEYVEKNVSSLAEGIYAEMRSQREKTIYWKQVLFNDYSLKYSMSDQLYILKNLPGPDDIQLFDKPEEHLKSKVHPLEFDLTESSDSTATYKLSPYTVKTVTVKKMFKTTQEQIRVSNYSKIIEYYLPLAEKYIQDTYDFTFKIELVSKNNNDQYDLIFHVVRL